MPNSTWWRLLRRQALPFCLITTAGVLLTVAVIFLAPRTYQSKAKLLLKIGRENVSLDPTVTTTGEIVSLHRTFDSEINTALRTMGSREILEMVVEEVGEETILRGSLGEQPRRSKGPIGRLKSTIKSWVAHLDPIDDRERAILKLQDNLEIEAATESSVVDVTFKSKTPELARRVTEAWVDLYCSHHAEINATEGSLDFFRDEERQLAASLAEARNALQARKSQSGIVTVDGEQQTLESQLRWAKSSLSETSVALAAAEARLESLRRQRETLDTTMVTSESEMDTNEAQDRMRDRLYQLELEERRLASKYTDAHPTYVPVRKQLEEARELYSQQKAQSRQVTEGVNPLYTTITEQMALEKANIESLQAHAAATRTTLQELLNDSSALNDHENELALLQREVDILEAQYRTHVEKREQARMAMELEAKNISNVNVFQAASLERRPVTPNKKLCALLGLVGSLMAALGFVALREAHRVGDGALGESPWATNGRETRDRGDAFGEGRLTESGFARASIASGDGGPKDGSTTSILPAREDGQPPSHPR